MRGLRRILGIIITLIVINTGLYRVDAFDNINFKNITIEQGLSQSTVETMIQDSKGYLWFGTNDGLNRYNGYEFKVYKNNKNSKNSLVSNYIIESNSVEESGASTYKVVPVNTEEYKYVSNANKEYNNLGVAYDDKVISMNTVPTITMDKTYVQVEEGETLKLTAENLGITMSDEDAEDQNALTLEVKDKSNNKVITEFQKSTPGVYELECVAIDSYGEKSEAVTINVNVSLSDVKTAPTITRNNEKLQDITISGGDIFKPLENVKAVDAKGRNVDVDLSVDRELDLDPDVDTVYTLTYTATDIYGNIASEVIKLTVEANKPPVINGVKDHVIKVGDSFDPEAGVTVDDEDKDIELKVESNVNTAIPGTYKVLYIATDSKGKTTRVQSVVTVNPKVATINSIPVITASDKTIKVGDRFTDEDALVGVSAYDEEDKDITSSIKVVENNVKTDIEGKYTVRYSVEDSKGAKATKTITVTVNPKSSIINSIPVITASDKTIKVGDRFTNEDALVGVTAYDEEDKDITGSIKVVENNVDTTIEGEYTVRYSVEDSKGAKATKTITVTVKKELALVDKVTINNKFDKLFVGGEKVLTASVDESADIKEIEWSTSDNNIASIEVVGNNARVIAKSAGSVTITVKAVDGSNKSDSVTIEVMNFEDDKTIPNNIKDVIDTNVVSPISGTGEIDNPIELEVKAIETNKFNEFVNRLKELNAVVYSKYEEDNFTVYKIKLTQKNRLFTLKSSTDSYITIKVDNNLENAQEMKNILNNISNQAPEIFIDGLKTTITVGDKFNKLDGVSAIDFEDGNITDKIIVTGDVDTSKAGEYELKYEVTDKNGNKSSITVIITVVEKQVVDPDQPTNPTNTLPVISLTSSINKLYVGDSFNALDGVKAMDKEDGDLTKYITVSGEVDTSKIGKYTIVYSVKDSDLNEVNLKRVIEVVERPEEDTTNPKTGDVGMLGFVGISGLALGGLLLNRRIKNK
ncbi:DUF5011 domain-containing protein [Romboutsia sp. CE17]|uniref:immunoglobulin-like domain-containing protein n=1 Tax=Romboutsia sp. CE17 TaxID=2724150 RepID=UPI001442C06D|nr:immunoglobulin-like domain-containing protein [Romboutsia sp. CE17]QJA07700.1 DUF5011 domain-containing protein [Romboutsia sp. CE17]